MPKPRRGGNGGYSGLNQRYYVPNQTATPAPNAQPVTNPLQNQIDDSNGTPVLTNAPTEISKLTDDELAQLFIASQVADLPDQLNDAGQYSQTNYVQQKFVYHAGLNGKPTILDDASFINYVHQNGLYNQILSRSVNAVSYQVGVTNYKMSADKICDQFKTGRLNYVGGKHGGTAHGYGVYFAKTNGNTGYGGTTMSGVLNPQTANVITERSLTTKAQSWSASHPKFTRAVGRYNKDNMGIYAIAMGYNVIDTQNYGGYHVILDRSAMIMKKSNN